MGWLYRPGRGHRCDLPSLDGYRVADDYIKGWGWECDECHRVWIVRENEDGFLFDPLWIWTWAWPWERRRFRKMTQHDDGPERSIL